MNRRCRATITERSLPRLRKVVITGISGRLGRIVARRLHHELDWQIVGLDRRPMLGRPKDIEHHQVDLRSKKARDVFRGGDVDALVHLGVMHDPRARPAELYSWNIAGTTKLLEYCQAYRVPKVVLLSSRERLRPAPRQPAVPDRGRAAARGAAVPADARPRRDRSSGVDVPVARAGRSRP